MVLEDKANFPVSKTGKVGFPEYERICVIQDDGSAVGIFQGAQYVKEGALAATGWPPDRYGIPAVDMKIEPVKYDQGVSRRRITF